LTDYAIAAAVIFAINLLPAFGPPTWSILIVLTLNFDLSMAIIVPLGAVAAASGRFTLACGARAVRDRVSVNRRTNLDAARSLLTGNRRRTLGGLGLFAISPLPSAQLFVAAGLLAVPLVGLTLAFFCGRLISYSLYVGAASAAERSLGGVVGESLTSPVGVALQILMLGMLVALWRVDWTRFQRDVQAAPPFSLRR
jgi:hypothetical protein